MSDDYLIDELRAQITDLRTAAQSLYTELQDLRGQRQPPTPSDDSVVFLAPRLL